MVRAVTFEAHDNLIHYGWYPRLLRLAERCRAAGIELPPEAARAAAGACRRYEEDHHLKGARTTASWVDARDAAGLAAAGITQDIPSTLQRLRDAARSMPARFPETEGYILDPDALPVLEALQARGIRAGIVSNMPRSLNGILDRLGIARYFQAVVACGDHDGKEPGIAPEMQKPDEALYGLACERLGVQPSDCLHVGDSPYDDGGFAACGARVVIYDPLDCMDAAAERVSKLLDIVSILDQERTP